MPRLSLLEHPATSSGREHSRVPAIRRQRCALQSRRADEQGGRNTGFRQQGGRHLQHIRVGVVEGDPASRAIELHPGWFTLLERLSPDFAPAGERVRRELESS